MRPSLILLSLTGLVLAACSGLRAAAPAGTVNDPGSNPPQTASDYPDKGPAPELTNDTWINSDAPLRLADLRGKVVLLEMWTFDCINCQHVVPMVEQWYKTYQRLGLVVIGNHYPEFSFERDLGNLKDAVQKQGITYPVVQDNDGKTWDAYNNMYWPTLYLIDKRGHIRYEHIGEGAYDLTEAAIQALLVEPYDPNHL